MPLSPNERNTIKQSVINAIGSPAGEWWGVPISGGFRIGASKKPIEWFFTLPPLHQRALVYVIFNHMRDTVTFNGRSYPVWFIPYQAVEGHGWAGRRCPYYSADATKGIWGSNVTGYAKNDTQYYRWVEEYYKSGGNPDVACQVIDNIFSWQRAKEWYYGKITANNQTLELWVGLYNYNKTSRFNGNTADQLHQFLLSLLPDIYCDAIDMLEPKPSPKEPVIPSKANAVIFSRGEYTDNSTNYVMIHTTTADEIATVSALLKNKTIQRGKNVVFNALYQPSNKTKATIQVRGVFVPEEVKYDMTVQSWVVVREPQYPIHTYTLRNWLTYNQAVAILNAL